MEVSAFSLCLLRSTNFAILGGDSQYIRLHSTIAERMRHFFVNTTILDAPYPFA
jgi:hypothetical protein